MKTKKLIINLLSIILISVIYVSCSDDRLEKDQDTEYAPLDDFYNLHQPEEQSFVIDSLGGDTIVGIHGTKIWGVPKTIFMKKSDFQDITYPFTLKLLEAYSIKDMILSKLPGLAQGNLLQSNCELKITAFKDNDELALKEHCGLPFWSPCANPIENTGIFYGFTNGSTDDWNHNVLSTDYLFTADTITSCVLTSNGYTGRIVKTGWLNLAKNFALSAPSTIHFTAEGLNTNYIDIYVVFNNLHTYIKVSNLIAQNLPTGEDITVFVLAKDATGLMYYFKNNYILANGLEIPLQMTESSETEILTLMENL